MADVTVIPDSWLSRALDGFGFIAMGIIKMLHSKSEKQAIAIQNLETSHAVLKGSLGSLENGVSDINEKLDDYMHETRNDIKTLLQRRP